MMWRLEGKTKYLFGCLDCYIRNKIIITNAFVKKAQKLRKQEKDRAKAARKDYIERVREGKYYEE